MTSLAPDHGVFEVFSIPERNRGDILDLRSPRNFSGFMTISGVSWMSCLIFETVFFGMLP